MDENAEDDDELLEDEDPLDDSLNAVIPVVSKKDVRRKIEELMEQRALNSHLKDVFDDY